MLSRCGKARLAKRSGPPHDRGACSALQNGRRTLQPLRPHPPRVGGISGPARQRGGLLTRMSPGGDSETQRRFRSLGRVHRLSIRISLFSGPACGTTRAPATACPLRTYDKTPVPPGPRASVNISAHDSWAERDWLPKRNSIRTHRQGPPEVWFRILHVAPDDHNVIFGAALHEQTVDVALGPKGAFEHESVGTLKRRVPADRVVNVAAKARRPAKPPRQPQTPRAAEFLRKAQEWRRQLDAGEVRTQAEIARREGITRARVTQIMALLRLAPEIQDRVLSLPEITCRSVVTERALRPIALLESPATQHDLFRELVLRTE